MKTLKLLLILLLMSGWTTVYAEDIVQAVPFITKPGIQTSEYKYFSINMNNTADIWALQFNITLPEGFEIMAPDLTDYNMERMPYSSGKSGNTPKHNKATADKQSDGSWLIVIATTEEDRINGNSGEIIKLYYTTENSVATGVYPIKVDRTVMTITGTSDIQPETSYSYVVVSEDGTTNPLSTSATINLSGMTGYMPSFVVTELNTAIASNTNLKTLNLSGVTGLGADLVVPEGAFWHTSNAAKLNRTFSSGVKSTICLPFAISSSARDEMGKFYQFDGITDGKVVMREAAAGELAANVPYIFDPSTTVAGIGVTDATISFSNSPVTENTEAKFTFTGTYSSITWPSPSGIYGFATAGHDGWTAGQFVRAGAGASITPYRAYLAYTGEGTLNASRRTRGDDGLPDSMPVIYITNNGETTGIATIDTPQVEEASEWYSLDGMRYAEKPSRKGIYISNGRKVVIK